MATSPLLSSSSSSSSSSSLHSLFRFSLMDLPIFLTFFLAASLLLLFFSLYSRKRKAHNPSPLIEISLPQTAPQNHPLIVKILASDHSFDSEFRASPSPLSGDCVKGSAFDVSEYCEGGEEVKGRKKKKRGRKKRQNCAGQSELEGGNACLDWLYPFTSSSSVTQRKIKHHYDLLLKSNDDKGLTLGQVVQFANCLIEARSELQHKSEVIQRRFTITKALLFKAERSSFDRLWQQISKLEAEQKRLEDDTLVYNRLQEQLKLSPAYRKMLEIASRMELKASAAQFVENTDAEFSDISFEELLAQEKKDSFWQKNGKLRSITN